MSNKYQREIEEILRNLEGTDSKAGRGQKSGESFRRKAGHRPPSRGWSYFLARLKPTDWLIVAAIIGALVAGGLAYAREPDYITGIIAILSFLCLVAVIVSPFISRPSSRPYRRDSNITRLRFNPFRGLVTRWNLFMLKRRYRRKNDG
jgi:hypothetical protein